MHKPTDRRSTPTQPVTGLSFPFPFPESHAQNVRYSPKTATRIIAPATPRAVPPAARTHSRGR